MTSVGVTASCENENVPSTVFSWTFVAPWSASHSSAWPSSADAACGAAAMAVAPMDASGRQGTRRACRWCCVYPFIESFDLSKVGARAVVHIGGSSSRIRHWTFIRKVGIVPFVRSSPFASTEDMARSSTKYEPGSTKLSMSIFQYTHFDGARNR